MLSITLNDTQRAALRQQTRHVVGRSRNAPAVCCFVPRATPPQISPLMDSDTTTVRRRLKRYERHSWVERVDSLAATAHQKACCWRHRPDVDQPVPCQLWLPGSTLDSDSADNPPAGAALPAHRRHHLAEGAEAGFRWTWPT